MDRGMKNTPLTPPQSIVNKEPGKSFDSVIADNNNDLVKTTDTNNNINEKKKTTLSSSKNELEQGQATTLTYCSHVGLDGTLILIWHIVAIAGYILILAYYSAEFSKLQREGVWLFILVPLLYFVSFVLNIRSWKTAARMYTNQAKNRDTDYSTDTSNAYIQMLQIYRKWSINGEYFLWKLFTSEFLESVNQLVNTFQIYLCSFEPIVICIVSCLFFGDSIFRAYYISQTNTPKRRKRQHICDGIMDFLCMVVPVVLIVFKYNALILINEMILIIILPSIFLMLKFRTLFREIIRTRSNNIVLGAQARVSFNLGRNRASIFGSNRTLKMARKQQEVIPKQIRIGFLIYNVGYAFLMLFIGVMSLIGINAAEQKCGNEPLWENNCKVPVPICTSLFTPTCNCVVLQVSEHNMTTLPNVFLEMNALKHVTINNGPLETLPNGMNTFQKLSVLDLGYNQIGAFDDSLEGLPLTYLNANYNKVKEIPNVVFTLEKLVWLCLIGNNIVSINPSIHGLTDLSNLLLTNNSIRKLPPELFKLDLAALYLDGNNITEIPADIYKCKHMLIMRFDNNPLLKVIPNEIGEMPRLRSLDLRYNSIQSLPMTFKKASNLKYLFLDGNTICKNDAWQSNKPPNIDVVISGCTKQCSKFCQDIFPAKGLKKGKCLNECSMRACIDCKSCDACQCGCNM